MSTKLIKKINEVLTHNEGKELPIWVVKSGNKPSNFSYDGSAFTWLDGIWHSGTWKYGTWLDGIWHSGTWLDGTWKGGAWKAGVWEGGYWKGGTWTGGVWKDGIWDEGWILDKEKKGNFKEDWQWDGYYVKSPISPKEYFK